MEAKDIILLMKKDLDIAQDMNLISSNGKYQEALIRVITKITNTILEKKLTDMGLIKPRKKKTKPVVCFRCQGTGHIARDCKGEIKCKHCSGKHFTRECPTRNCQECGKRHPKGQCKKKDTWCKWCKIWNQHPTKECPNGGILRRLAKLEKATPKLRPKSFANPRRVTRITPGRGRGMAKIRRTRARGKPMELKDSLMNVE